MTPLLSLPLSLLLLLGGCAADLDYDSDTDTNCESDKCDNQGTDLLSCNGLEQQPLADCLFENNDRLAEAGGLEFELGEYRDLESLLDFVTSNHGADFYGLDTAGRTIRIEKGALAMMTSTADFDPLLDERVTMAPEVCLTKYQESYGSDSPLEELRVLSNCVRDLATEKKDSVVAALSTKLYTDSGITLSVVNMLTQLYLEIGWSLCEATSRVVGDDKYKSPRVEGCVVATNSIWYEQMTAWSSGDL